MNHGKFGELPEVKGDNITGHHMPSNKYVNDKYSIETDESYAINLEHPHPGRVEDIDGLYLWIEFKNKTRRF